MTDELDMTEVRKAARLIKRVMWSGVDGRRVLNEMGISVTPANFYSIVPTVEDLESSFEYTESAPYMDEGVFDDGLMTEYLANTLMPYSREFDPPEHGSDPPTDYYWANPAFSYSDAMSYYCALRAQRPETVIEVGSGYSTLVAREALKRNGTGRLITVEPFPMPWLRGLPDVELHETPVQKLEPAWFNDRLRDGDVLFIDSTHVVKSGSDCAHLYLRVLPRLETDLLVHVHDIYLPTVMPRNKVDRANIYWNEGYILLALLLENPRMQLVYGSRYHWLFNRERLTAFMHGRWEAGGASVWMRRTRQTT